MKEFDIYLPSRHTECDIFVYTLPVYNGLTVNSGLVIASEVIDYVMEYISRVDAGMLLDSSVEETFKLVHEAVESGILVDIDARISSVYGVHPEGSSIVISSDPAKLSATGILRISDGMVIDSSLLQMQYSRSLGRGESSLVIDSAVDGMVKHGFLADVQPGIIIGSDASFTPCVVARPQEYGIVVDAAASTASLTRATGAESSLVIVSSGEAILSHSLGKSDFDLIIASAVTGTSKVSHTTVESGAVLGADALETKRLNKFAVDNAIELRDSLKNLCYTILLTVDEGIVIDSEGAVTPNKVMYMEESGIEIDSSAKGVTVKAFEAENGILVDSDAAGMLNKRETADDSGIVFDSDVERTGLLRARLLSEIDDYYLEDIDEETLYDLYYVVLA